MNDGLFTQDATMMTAFQARYGTDRTVADQRVPQPLRPQTVIDYNLIDDGGDFDGKSHQASSSHGSGRRVVGGALVSQLFLHHLECTGSKDIAETLREELSQQRVDETCYLQAVSPIAFNTTSWTTGAFKSPAEKDLLSSLQLLLCPAANTREKVILLLSDARKKIIDTCVGISRNESHLDALTAMVMAPLWNDSTSSSSTLLVRNEQTGRIVAGSLNQLVEQLTCVFITPHVSRSEERLAMDDAFTKSLLMTHRYFTSSHALLAKLLQRFFVPCSIPFSEQYDQRGVLINAPASLFSTVRSPYNGQPLGKRTALYVEATRLIQIKVCCVIAQWLNLLPSHFDRTMLEAIEAFVAENCYVPAVWADCPAQLMQAAEFIKEGVYRVRNPSAFDNFSAQQSLPPTLAGSANAVSSETPVKKSAPVTPTAVKHNSEAVLSHLFGGEEPHLGVQHNSNAGDGVTGTLTATPAISLEQLSYVNNFLAEDDLDVAMRLAAIDHETFRRISSSELFLVAVNNGIAQLHGASHPSLCLINHLRGLEEVTSWATSLVLIAGYHDSTQKPTTTNAAPTRFVKMERIVEKLVSIAYRLLELNDLHSAFGIVAGLRHPAVARLHQPIIVGRFQKVSVFESLSALLAIFKFEKGIAAFEEYVAAIPDTDVFPAVPLVHITVDEIRSLITSQPTIVRAPSSADSKTSGGGPVPLIHWRKFFVLSSIFDSFQASQRAPVPGTLIADSSAARWKARAVSHAIGNPKTLVQLSAAIWPL